MQDQTAEQRPAPGARVGESYANGRAGDGRQSAAASGLPEEMTPAGPSASVTYVERMMVAETIVNHYHCRKQHGCDILESAPGAGQEESQVENVTLPGVELITASHAEILSDEYWRPRGLKGRSRQTILQQRNRIQHIQSANPPEGRGVTLFVRAAFEAWDQANPPREWPTARADRAA